METVELKTLSDLELAKLVAQLNGTFFQVQQNLQSVNQELANRLAKKDEEEKAKQKFE